MTTLNVTLSQLLQQELLENGSGNGVAAYAVYFGAAGNPHWTPLVIDGVLQSAVDPTSGTASILLPSTMNGGKVYFLVQSQGGTPTDLQTAITQQSDISWANADTNSYRYDSIELSLLNEAGDAANLTSVEGFGLPMELSVPETGSRSYNVSATTLFGDLNNTALVPTVDLFEDGGALNGKPRMALSPTAAVAIDNTQPFKTSDWNDYIADLSTALAGSSPPTIVVNGFFNGAPDLQGGLPPGSVGEWRNGGYFSYHLEWDGTVFWLSPDPTYSQIKGHIRITTEELSQSIYSSLGEVTVYTNKTDADPYEVYATGPIPSSEMGVGANNQWGKVLQQFTNGFTAGYYQVTGQSLNADVTAPIDLNKNYNWDPTFAFGNHLSSGQQPAFMDKYSKVFFDNSNSYGSTYSDALMNAYDAGGPLLPVFANGSDVSEINVTIFADGETPTGYVAPTIANYIAPGGATYAVPTQANSGLSNITLNFGPGQAMYLADDTPIYFEFLTGYDTVSGAPQWSRVQLGGQSGTPWQTWTYSPDASSVTGNGGLNQTPGSLVIVGMPLAESGVTWYRIIVGTDGDARQKTFNLYTTTDNSEFVNPATYDNSFAVDGLATLEPGALNPDGSMLTFSVNVTGTTPTLDLSLMQWNTTAAYISSLVTPTAPVVGTVTAGAFTALTGQSSTAPSSAQAIDVDNANVSFGWTGLNSYVDTGSWISGYTNKIHGLATAQVSFLTDAGGPTGINPWMATADIDGQWFTSPGQQQLSDGSYQVVMTEYAAGSAVGKTSAPVYINVSVEEMPLAVGSDGRSITLLPDLLGPDPGGNWIKLAALSSSLPKAATILLYATDSTGQLVARDGRTGPGVTLDDAVLGTVGSVPSDAGVTLVEGTQSVYLPIGQKLNFAIQVGDGAPNTAANITVTPNGDGSFNINVGGVVVSAVTENTLSDVDQMGSVQRFHNLPMLYLDHGATLEVQAAGSCGNTNTLAFVRFDIDFATNQISVDGVAYGNTPAFRAAVVANLDDGYRGHHGGQFNDVSSWTVQGETGYYAPVLLTQNGDVFVVGAGNVGNAEYIQSFGANTFGFEDLTAAQGSDFDYNDMIMHISPFGGSGGADPQFRLSSDSDYLF